MRENIIEYLYEYFEHSIIKYDLLVNNIVGIYIDNANIKKIKFICFPIVVTE